MLAKTILAIAFGVGGLNASPFPTALDQSTQNAPVVPASSIEERATKYTGDAGWYKTGATSCGGTYSDNDRLVAISPKFGAHNAYCGRKVSITNKNNGKTVTAYVRDECAHCPKTFLDLSPGAFSAIANLNDNVIPVSWQFI